MFVVDCPVHASRVLLGPDDIVALINTPAGIELSYRCSCGHEGVWRASETPETVPARLTSRRSFGADES